MKLVIGNKNYSSWSMRPWLVMTHFGLPFEEERIPLDTPEFAQRVARYGTAGRVPILIDGERTVWDTLAICEYLAELFPQRGLWPANATLRARARSVSAEMHSGFTALRGTMPMNCRATRRVAISTGVAADIRRIDQIWSDCRAAADVGDFLFGAFSIADAFYAPVVSRLRTYGVEMSPVANDYRRAIESLPAFQSWVNAGKQETEVVPSDEAGQEL